MRASGLHGIAKAAHRLFVVLGTPHCSLLLSIVFVGHALCAPSVQAQPLSRAQMLSEIQASQELAYKDLERELLLLRRQRMMIEAGKVLRVVGERQDLGSDWNPENAYWAAALRLLTDALTQQSPLSTEEVLAESRRSLEQAGLLGDDELRDVHRYFTSKAFRQSQAYFTYAIRMMRTIAQRKDENASAAAKREAEAALLGLKEPAESADEEAEHKALLTSAGMRALYKYAGGENALAGILKRASAGERPRVENSALQRVREVIRAFRQGTPLESVGATP